MVAAVASGVTAGEPAPKNSVSEESPEFVTQTLPEPSMATAVGVLRPPPVKPADGDTAVPPDVSVETVLFELAIQTEPAPSMATLTGEFTPPALV